MDLRGQEKRSLGMPNSLGSFNPSNIGEPAASKISSSASLISSIGGERRRDHVGCTTGNGIAVLSPPVPSHTVDHHHYQQQIRQESPEPAPPPSQSQGRGEDLERDPDPVSIAVVSTAIAPIVASGGSNPRTPKPKASSSSSSVRYRECLKNHAASAGGHVVDGCGEFMPSGEEGTPDALKCAACDCHRNFHRKEVEGETQQGANCFYCYNPNNKIDGARRSRVPSHPLVPPPPSFQQHQKFSLGLPSSPPLGPIPPMMMAFGGGAATDSSSEELNVYHSNAGATAVPPQQFALSKKRFRTKFTQEQKDRMLEFAEKVGWRIQKQDELAVQQFCAEVGVKRQVLKVWMHNNKHAMKKKLDT